MMLLHCPAFCFPYTSSYNPNKWLGEKHRNKHSMVKRGCWGMLFSSGGWVKFGQVRVVMFKIWLWILLHLGASCKAVLMQLVVHSILVTGTCRR